MNRENILKVADAIEHAAKKRSRPKLGFNMRTVRGIPLPDAPDMTGHNCQTIACIAGWTQAVHKLPESNFWARDTREVLGLTHDEAHALFEPPYWWEGKYTTAKAVAVLRHLAESGEVDWTVGAPS